jgi:hypothetical protein
VGLWELTEPVLMNAESKGFADEQTAVVEFNYRL